MSPHRISGFFASESGSSTPVLIDDSSDMERSSLNSSINEEADRTSNPVNEPIAIIGIGELLADQPIDHLLMSSRLSASRRGQIRRGSLESLNGRALWSK